MDSRKRRRILNEDDVNDDDDDKDKDLIKVIDNHIYFYSDISRNSAFKLNEVFQKMSFNLLNNQFTMKEDDNFIYLHIFSNGGDVFAAFAIIDIIKKSKIPVVSIIEGCAASAATLVSICCTKRLIHQHAFMLVHEISSGFFGKMSECKDDIKNMKSLMKSLKKIYKEYTDIDFDKMDEILKHDIWWSAKKCLKYRLVDRII
tara:strand:+ start:384 stop:989 length:606 start_codon:yes stop_codon:yes gene_type:complete